MPPRVRPMLASPSTSQGGRVPVSIDTLTDGWLFQEKIDGVRAQLRHDGDTVRITGRSGNDLTRQFPEIVEAALTMPRMSLDGEITLPGQGLDALLSRVKRDAGPKLSDSPALFTAFDCLWLNGDFVAEDMGLMDRLVALDSVVLSDSTTRIRQAHRNPHGRRMFDHIAGLKGEGVVAKRLDSRYLPGRRGWSWVKFKHTYTVLCIVSGKSGERGNGVTLHMVGNGSQLVPVGSVGAGLTAQHLANVDAALNVHGFPVAIVECLGISSGNKLRMPVFKGFHPDPNLLLASVDQLAELPVTT